MVRRPILGRAVLTILPVTMSCAESSSPQPSVDASGTVDAPTGMDVPFDGTDDEPEGGPTGYFITGELAGVVRFAPYNIEPKPPNYTLIEARIAPSQSASYWSFNSYDPMGPFPVTASCGDDIIFYLQFIDKEASPPHTYSSRSPMGSCAFTYVEPSSPDVYEGTFSAVLLRADVQTYFAVTEGRFRYPRWKDGGR